MGSTQKPEPPVDPHKQKYNNTDIIFFVMDKLRDSISSMVRALRHGDKDQWIASQIEKQVQQLTLRTVPDFQLCVELMVQVYDASNHPLFLNQDTHSLSLRLKTIVISMMSAVMNSSAARHIKFDQCIYEMGMQILIMCIHVLNNHGQQNKTQSAYLYCRDMEKFLQKPLEEPLRKLHLLNTMEIMRLVIEREELDIDDLQRKHQMLLSMSCLTDTEKQYWEYSILEIAMKLGRKGKSAQMNQILEFVDECEAKRVVMGALEKGRWYQLYTQIQQNGMEGINEKFLQDEIRNSDGNQLVEIAALTLEPRLLLLWFRAVNMNKIQMNALYKAYECFMKLMQNYFHHPNHLQLHLNLCTQVLVSLLPLKKPHHQQVNQTLKCIMKLTIELVREMYPHQEVFTSICSQIQLVSLKHEHPDILNSLSQLQLYQGALQHKYEPNLYHKYKKHHQHNNQLSTVLEAAYLQRLEQQQPSQQVQKLLLKHPQYRLLMPEQYDFTCVLQLPFDQFVEFPIFFVYRMLLLYDHKHSLKIVQHMYITLCKIQPSQLNPHQLPLLIEVLRQLVDEGMIYAMSCLFCLALMKAWNTLQDKKCDFMLLNRYSKLLWVLREVEVDDEAVKLMEVILMKRCEEMKRENIDGNVQVEAGQVAFLKQLWEFVIAGEQESSVKDYVTYGMVEMLWMVGREEDSWDVLQGRDDIMKLAIKSAIIPKQLKLRLSRALIASSLSEGSQPPITLQTLSELLQLSTTPQQCALYADYIIKAYGNKGKQLIQFMANQNTALSTLLINQ